MNRTCQAEYLLKDFSTIFEQRENRQNWLKSWAPYKHIPLRKQDHFISDIAKICLDYHQIPQDSSLIYYEYLLEVILRKPSEEIKLPLENYRYKNLTLTVREVQILKYFLRGKSAKEIACLLLMLHYALISLLWPIRQGIFGKLLLQQRDPGCFVEI